MKKYKDLDAIEKRIVSRKHAEQKTNNKYSFLVFVIVLIICYFISEYVNSYIIIPIIIIAIVWYIAHEIIVRKWYESNDVKITKKDIIIYGTDYEIYKKLEEKVDKNVKKKIKKPRHKSTKKNI